ncbi:MAG: family transposase [Nitrospirae bacterium]|jgi:transposase|nr:family transposase [Nitrospirota bacterium]
MKKDYHGRRILATGTDVNIGIDVHKESWHVTVMSEGEEIFHGRMPSSYQAFKRFLARFKNCRIRVAYEAGPCGFWLYDKLMADGVKTIVTPPSLIPMESGNKVKTDKKDSRKLANLLGKGMLKEVHVLSAKERSEREIVRTRRQLVGHCSDVARQIKSKLLFNGIQYSASGRERWTKGYIKWLRELSCKEESLKISLMSLLDLYEYLSQQIKKISKELVALSQMERYRARVALVRSVPGIGLLNAMELLVELQEIGRFKSARELASYTGLTPSEYSTGQHIRQGGITRCGNKRVRAALVESSWILVGKDPYMRCKYTKLKNRKGGKRAIVAIARNLVVRLRKMLITNEPYRIGMQVKVVNP